MEDLVKRFQDAKLDQTAMLYNPERQQLTSFYPWMLWLKAISNEDEIFLGWCLSNFLTRPKGNLLELSKSSIVSDEVDKGYQAFQSIQTL